MPRMVLKLERGVKVKLRRLRRSTKDKGLATRCQIILLAGRGRSQSAIADSLGCSRSWACEVIQRFGEFGIAGLCDRREDNGQVKLDGRFLSVLYDTIDESPQDYGFLRPTWTRELLVKVMAEKTGVKIHPATMSRALAKIGARRGRPRPTVNCPWKKAAKTRRLRELAELLEGVPADEPVFYEDEVDIHLNPKIGLDWMNRGTQKEVLTPGQNEKCYLAGALNARTGRLVWVGGEKKNSLLFIELLKELIRRNPKAPVIHVILDNYRIHDSRAVQAALTGWGGRIKLHFLPPYCPNENRIERVWKDLHDNVTRNHRCRTMTELVQQVLVYLDQRNRHGTSCLYRSAA
jgi:transposase